MIAERDATKLLSAELLDAREKASESAKSREAVELLKAHARDGKTKDELVETLIEICLLSTYDAADDLHRLYHGRRGHSDYICHSPLPISHLFIIHPPLTANPSALLISHFATLPIYHLHY